MLLFNVKEVYTFPGSIFPEVDVIARLEFELAYYDFAVDRFCQSWSDIAVSS